MYKLIAIDLDGTLLNSKKEISPANRQAVEKAAAMGVKVVVCSGRVYNSARLYACLLDTGGPLVASNGAVIKDLDDGRILFQRGIRPEDCRKVIDICHAHDLYFYVCIGDTIYSEKLAYSTLFYMETNKSLPEDRRVDVIVVDNALKAIEEDPRPILLIRAISERPEELKAARQKAGMISSLTVTSSGDNNFEVQKAGVNKGEALKFLSNHFGLPLEKTMAIGDNENDLDMIKYAGLGVAMGNAAELLKKAADYVTLTEDQDGVAHAINRFVL